MDEVRIHEAWRPSEEEPDHYARTQIPPLLAGAPNRDQHIRGSTRENLPANPEKGDDPVRLQREELQCNHRWEQWKCDPSRHSPDRLQNDLKTRTSKVDNAQETTNPNSREQIGSYPAKKQRLLPISEKNNGKSYANSSRPYHESQGRGSNEPPMSVYFHMRFSSDATLLFNRRKVYR